MSRASDSGVWRGERIAVTLSLVLLLAGAAGYFGLPRGGWPFYASAHVGAVGLLGLLASAAGALARRKGRRFGAVFSMSVVLSAVLGIAAVAVFYFDRGELYCGGSVCLAVALLAIGATAAVRPRAGA